MRRIERELRRKRKGWHTLFFFCVLLPMLVVFPYIRDVNNPNEFVRVFTVMSLVESHTFRSDEQVATFGWVNDMARVPGNEDHVDHYYLVKAPAILYPGIPGYLVMSRIIAPLLGHKYPGVWGGHWKPEPGVAAVNAPLAEKLWWLRMATWSMRLTASNIPCFLFLLWFERYLRNFSSDAVIRYAAVTACGLGTNYLAYTHMFASHSQYAAIAFLAFATIESELRRSRGDVLAMRPSRALLAGFLTSACVTLEYHALFMTVIMSLFATLVFFRPAAAFLWVVGQKKRIALGTSPTPTRLLAYAFGGLLNIPHMMYFHWTAYGNPLTPGHQKLETARFAVEHKTGLWGILWPTWGHIQALAIDPSFGFFGMSPYMWLGLLGVPLILISPFGGPSRRAYLRASSVAWLLCMVMVFGVNAGFIEWRAGWTVGPRYLVVCAPFFAFGGAVALERFSQRNHARRAMARGLGGGLALAGVLAIGTVGLVYDTLPETIARPFAQFALPLMRVGVVPHHIGEWFGWTSTTLWYIACAALILAPIVATFAPQRSERRSDTVLRTLTFLAALGAGIVPAFSPPEDQTKLFVLHPSTAGIGTIMEPPGRDRLTLTREQAEALGSRGRGPCLWWKVASFEHTMNQEAKAVRDEAKAASMAARDRCPRVMF